MSGLRSYLKRVPALALAVHAARRWRRHWNAIPQETPFGFKLMGNRAMESGEFEEAEIALLRNLLRPTDVFVDVGANIGLYTCLARSLGCAAIAIEPLVDNLHWLYANLSANGWNDTEVQPVGMGSEPGLANLYGSDTGASLVPGWAGVARHDFLRHVIPLNSLDNVLGERFRDRRLVIKVDIEGAELGMLKGATRTLTREPKPVWLAEIVLTEHRPDAWNPHFAATFDVFFSAGYEARLATDLSRIVYPADVRRWVAAGRCDHEAYNYLFTAAD
jgi:FkbM family methyltransferase